MAEGAASAFGSGVAALAALGALASAFVSCSVVVVVAGSPRRLASLVDAFYVVRRFGLGYVLATLPRCPYVYVLP